MRYALILAALLGGCQTPPGALYQYPPPQAYNGAAAAPGGATGADVAVAVLGALGRGARNMANDPAFAAPAAPTPLSMRCRSRPFGYYTQVTCD
jgi:hypothetical protein